MNESIAFYLQELKNREQVQKDEETASQRAMRIDAEARVFIKSFFFEWTGRPMADHELFEYRELLRETDPKKRVDGLKEYIKMRSLWNLNDACGPVNS